MLGDHKIAHSPIYFEDVLPDYLIDLIEKELLKSKKMNGKQAEVGNDEDRWRKPDLDSVMYLGLLNLIG